MPMSITSPLMAGFNLSGSLAAFISITRPDRVHFRYGARLCLPRLRWWDCSHNYRCGRLLAERTICKMGTFNPLDQPSLLGAPEKCETEKFGSQPKTSFHFSVPHFSV